MDVWQTLGYLRKFQGIKSMQKSKDLVGRNSDEVLDDDNDYGCTITTPKPV